MRIFELMVFIILFVACDQVNKKPAALVAQTSPLSSPTQETIPETIPKMVHIPYHFDYITETIIMHRDLKELSGLTYDDEHQLLLANNDEQGIIYSMDPSGQITQRDQFKKKGDFEGIEQVGNLVYIVNSKGDIYEYNQLTKEIKSFHTDLNLTNDVEGLGLDGEYLLLACKGSGDLGVFKKPKKEKAIYRFSLQTKELEAQAKYIISDEELENWVYNYIDQNELSKKKFKKLIKRVKQFSPSGIAVNPVDNLIYIVSSAGKSLVIIDHENNIKKIVFLDKKIFVQPEAICFSKTGDLYIGNEAKGLIAKIYRFSMN